MSKRSRDALMRSDRILVGVLAMVLAAGSATVAATATYHPKPVPTQTAEAAEDSVAAIFRNAKTAQVKLAEAAAVTATDVSDRQVAHSSAEQSVLDKLLREHRCLSEAMYYEARGEGLKGQKAVAEVIFHRLRTGNYGQSICAVVYEGAYHPGCQFSFTCNGMMNQPKAMGAWTRSQVLAARILTGEVRLSDSTGGATSYHAVSVQPSWAEGLVRTVQIGNHIFYKNPYRSHAM